MALVTGGSGSGKSAWAEELLCTLCPGPKLYLATMPPSGPGAAAHIARHRSMRASKGFSTLECPGPLPISHIPPGSAVLLEDLSNLLANLRFSPAPPTDCVQVLWEQLSALARRCGHLVVVSNEIFSDGMAYDPDTMDYIALLGSLNRLLARRADLAAEVVCGIPLVLKGALPCPLPL